MEQHPLVLLLFISLSGKPQRRVCFILFYHSVCIMCFLQPRLAHTPAYHLSIYYHGVLLLCLGRKKRFLSGSNNLNKSF